MNYDWKLCHMCYKNISMGECLYYFQCCVCKIESKICDQCKDRMWLCYTNRCSDWCKINELLNGKLNSVSFNIVFDRIIDDVNNEYCNLMKRHQLSILSTFTHIVEKKENFTKAYLLQLFINDLVKIIIEYQ